MQVFMGSGLRRNDSICYWAFMMRAMQLDRPGVPLRLVERPIPEPGPGELLIKIAACGICRTDLHIVDGELSGPLPIVPGHEIVGRVVGTGERVGVPWLGRTCGRCP
jgi:propanol-preferring alcohol dehydrogenase